MGRTRRAVLSIREVYRRLRRRRGPVGWWPAESPFEICVGAILVQNTAWTNVEKALAVVRSSAGLSFAALDPLSAAELAPLIHSAGSFNVKARRLRAFLDFLGAEYGGRVERMRSEPAAVLRSKLLEVAGIGRETADSIALYAAGHPLFVIDAYTRRVFARLGLIEGNEAYDVLQRLFMDALPSDPILFGEYHGQIIELAKGACRTRPVCGACPLERQCPSAARALTA